MLHRITGRATKCGPSAISAIAGVPTHEAAAVIRRLFDRRSVNGVFMDELAAALAEFGWTPDYAIRHPKLRERRFARSEEAWERIFAGVPFDVRAMTLGTFLDPAPALEPGRSRRATISSPMPTASSRTPVPGLSANPAGGSAPTPTATGSQGGASARPSGSCAPPPATPTASRRRKADRPIAPGRPDSGPCAEYRPVRLRAGPSPTARKPR